MKRDFRERILRGVNNFINGDLFFVLFVLLFFLGVAFTLIFSHSFKANKFGIIITGVLMLGILGISCVNYLLAFVVRKNDYIVKKNIDKALAILEVLSYFFIIGVMAFSSERMIITLTIVLGLYLLNPIIMMIAKNITNKINKILVKSA